LKKGGKAKISVPDLEVLCRLFLDPGVGPEERSRVMKMMFGGQLDSFDFHYVGLTQEMLIPYLRDAGFSRLDRVEQFGMLQDDSVITCCGIPISLNVIAYK
jgi:predicted SAM-dependent methyltransferase